MIAVTLHPSAASISEDLIAIPDEDIPHLIKTYTRARQFAAGGVAVSVDLYLGDRNAADLPAYANPGWLEHVIIVKYKHGGGLEVHAIQRTIGADSEFHS